MNPSDTNIVLTVDLDGTLVLCDTSVVASLWLLKNKPQIFFKILPLLIIDRPKYKKILCEHHIPDPKSLPWSEKVLNFVREQKKLGRKVVLATGTNERIAKAVADYVTLFDEVMASDDHTNFIGKNKAAGLCKAFGEKGFDYMGNSWVDIPVWDKSRAVYVCHAVKKLQKYAKEKYSQLKIIE